MSRTATPKIWAKSPEWMRRGACQGKSELFFPENIVQQEKAIRICLNECTVLTECDNLATLNNEREGVWGGKMRGRIFRVNGRGRPPKYR